MGACLGVANFAKVTTASGSVEWDADIFMVFGFGEMGFLNVIIGNE